MVHWAALLGLIGCTGCLHDAGPPAAPAEAAGALRYTATIEGAPTTAVAELAERSLLTFRLQARGARNRVSLLRRVKHDEGRLEGLLRSQGYYTPAVNSDVGFPPDGPAHVTFVLHPGPAYTLREHALVFDSPATVRLPQFDAGALGSPVGAAARARPIVRAEEAVVTALHGEGYPYAAYLGRDGLADPDTETVTVTSTFAPGPFAVFGPVRFVGLETVREPYLLTYRSWEERSPLDRRALDTYQERLMATELFRTVSVRIPGEAPAGNGPVTLPVVVAVEEGPRRRFEAGARYDTDLGPAGRASWRHRNVFGANESLQVQMQVGRVKQGATLDMRKPQFRRPGQELAGKLDVARTDDHAFDARTATGSVGLTRRLTPRWAIGLGGFVEVSTIDEPVGTIDASLVGVSASATYDATDRALDPTTGHRLEFEAVPVAGRLDDRRVTFGRIDARGSIYRPVGTRARHVAAVRARAAMVVSKDLQSVPATRRLYAGGGGSVRGYAKSSIGPLGPDGTPTGGRSLLELEAEFRIRVGKDFGIVPFVAAGIVSEDTVPDGLSGVQAAVGIGARYFSRVGPIRVDLAVPLHARALDDSFAVYASIGQAF